MVVLRIATPLSAVRWSVAFGSSALVPMSPTNRPRPALLTLLSNEVYHAVQPAHAHAPASLDGSGHARSRAPVGITTKWLRPRQRPPSDIEARSGPTETR